MAQQPPSNDVFTNAWDLHIFGGKTNWTLAGALVDPGDPVDVNPGPSIWFRIRAPRSGYFEFRCKGDFEGPFLACFIDPQLRYLPAPDFGSSIPRLRRVGRPAGVLVQTNRFEVDTGNIYFVAIHGKAPEPQSQYELSWSFEEDPVRRPDLTVDPAQILPYIGIVDVPAWSCEIGHGCVLPGRRRLMNFGTSMVNQGNSDLMLAGHTNLLYEFHECHHHTHLLNFADFRLLRTDSPQVVRGLKTSFCVADSVRMTGEAALATKYDCTNPGLQKGWADLYTAGIACQWLDITGVAPGKYRLLVTADPDDFIPELSETNNSVLIQVTIPPEPYLHVNDDFDSAVELGNASYGLVEGENRGAGRERSEPPMHGGRESGEASVWYGWMATNTAEVIFQVSGVPAGFRPGLEVLSGRSLAELAAVSGGRHESADGPWYSVKFPAVAGSRYWIQVHSPTNVAAGFRMRWWAGKPAHDDFGNREHYDYLKGLASGYANIAATPQPDEPTIGGRIMKHSLWFPFLAWDTRLLTVTTDGSDFDTVMSAYQGNDLTNLVELATSDDRPGSLQSGVAISTVLGRLYWIAVDGKNGESGIVRMLYNYVDAVLHPVKVLPTGLEISGLASVGATVQLERSEDLKTWVPASESVVSDGNGEWKRSLERQGRGLEFFRVQVKRK